MKKFFLAFVTLIATICLISSCNKIDYNLPHTTALVSPITHHNHSDELTFGCPVLENKALTEAGKARHNALRIGADGKKTLLYVRFANETVTNSNWINYLNSGHPFTIQGVFTSNNVSDKNKRDSVMARLQEDFAIFGTYILTQDSVLYNNWDPNNRVRCTVTTNAAIIGNVGGIAWINSYYWGDNTECFVRADLLQNNASYIGNTVAHEFGHMFGLFHQSIQSTNTQYNPGYGTGNVSVGITMGVVFNKKYAAWLNGQMIDGTPQNDTAILAGLLDRRPDECGSTFATAFTSNALKELIGTIGIGDNGDMIHATSDVNKKRLLTLTSLGNLFPTVKMYDDRTYVLLKTITPLGSSLSVTDTLPSRKNFYLSISYKDTTAVPSTTGSYKVKMTTL